MIFEAVITTRNPDGGAHVTPMGYRLAHDHVVVAPFVPSRTLDNLHRERLAVLNLTDDVSVIAGCLTGRHDWPVVATDGYPAWRLRDTLGHEVLMVRHVEEDPARPRFFCEVVQQVVHRPFRGYNRAQAAVVEAAILVSRLDWLDPDQVARDMRYLEVAVEKTAGPVERKAWEWLRAAVGAHPRHQLPEGGDA